MFQTALKHKSLKTVKQAKIDVTFSPTSTACDVIGWVGEPVVGLPVLLSQCDEHLVGTVESVSVLHPHDVGLRHSLNRTAQPHRVPLRHRLIGRMLREQHTCSRDRRGEYEQSGLARC